MMSQQLKLKEKMAWFRLSWKGAAEYLPMPYQVMNVLLYLRIAGLIRRHQTVFHSAPNSKKFKSLSNHNSHRRRSATLTLTLMTVKMLCWAIVVANLSHLRSHPWNRNFTKPRYNSRVSILRVQERQQLSIIFQTLTQSLQLRWQQVLKF